MKKMDKMWHFLIFLTVLKRFCPLDSKNVFVLVLAHLEPELELFEVDDIGASPPEKAHGKCSF